MLEQLIVTSTSKQQLIEEIANEVLTGFRKILESNSKTDLDKKEWLTTKEVMEILKISQVSMWQYAKDGRLKVHKLNGRNRYNKHDVMNTLQIKESRRS